MEHRLNDVQLLASLDAGHQSLPWEPGQPSGLLAPLDLRAIAESPEVAEIVPALPVQALYYALKQQSVEDVLEILPYVSQEQTERMVDYEAWRKDELIPRKLLQFMSLFGEVSPELMAERFSELDEEYQLACMQGKFKVYESESIMDLPDELQERVSTMPCGKVFYEILTDDADEKALIEKLLDACKEYNLRYTYSLLSHASFVPPGEAELYAQKFRTARLEEDGFVSFEKSIELFMPFASEALQGRWKGRSQITESTTLSAGDEDVSFLDHVFTLGQAKHVDIDLLYQVHQGFLYLANAMCAATQTEADDVIGLQRLMEQGKALVNLGLESLAEGDLELGLEILLKEQARDLFRYGLSKIDALRAEVLEHLRALQIPRVDILSRAYHLRQWGRILLEIDRHWLELIGLESVETLKGLFNRFPMRPMLLDDGAQRIQFVPIISRADERAFRHSLAVMLGYFTAAMRTSLPLTQAFEVILRDHAIRSLSEGALANPDQNVGQLIHAWRDRLQQSASQWMLKGVLTPESVLDDICALIHEGLHGLIVLPKNSHSQSSFTDDERMS